MSWWPRAGGGPLARKSQGGRGAFGNGLGLSAGLSSDVEPETLGQRHVPGAAAPGSGTARVYAALGLHAVATDGNN